MHIAPVADAQDVETVVSLARDIWTEHYTPIIGASQVTYMLDRFQSAEAISGQLTEGHLYFLLRSDGGEAIGYLAVVPLPDELFLSKIYLTAGDRGRGHGREAIQFVAALAKERGLAKITLTVNKRNTASLDAYRRIGFVVVESLVTDIGSGYVMDDYKMELPVR